MTTSPSASKTPEGSVLQLLESVDEAYGQEEDCLNEVEHSSDDQTGEAERQQYEPYEWVEQECNQGERPAGDKQEAENEQLEHPNLS